MRDKAKRVKNALEGESAEGSSAWGKVKIKMNGNQEVLEVVLDPEYLKTEKAVKINEAVKDAVNDGLKKVQRLMVEKMRNMGELKF